MFKFFKKGRHDIKLNKIEVKKFDRFEEKKLISSEEQETKFDAEFDNVNLKLFGIIDKNTVKLIFNGKELIVELLGFTRDNYLVLKNKSDNELISTDKIKIFYDGDLQYIMLPLANSNDLTTLNIRINEKIFQFIYHLDMNSIQEIDLVSVIKAVTDNITLIA